MHISILQDGAELPSTQFQDLTAKGLLSQRDVKVLKGEQNVRVDCVGFSVNRSEDALLIFPKHYDVGGSADLGAFASVFSAIQKSAREAVSSRWGPNQDVAASPDIQTNFPFGAFYRILRHYQQYGLHFDEVTVDSKDRGKVNWKKTIARAEFFLTNGKLAFHPLRRENKVRASHLITDATVFAINHTVDLFGPLIRIGRIGYQTTIQSDVDLYESVVKRLQLVRSKTFNDRTLQLVDSLIEYFDKINYGQGFYFRSYNFAYVWQAAVAEYLSSRFCFIDDGGEPVFASASAGAGRFEKLVVKGVNSAAPNQKIDIDHYWYDPDRRIQYVFDAKYYAQVSELNYKQVFYTLIQSLDPAMQSIKTMSALILPACEIGSKLHFSLAPAFQDQLEMGNAGLDIIEIYLPCRAVMADFTTDASS